MLTPKQQLDLTHAFDMGYKIQIDSGPFVTGMVTSIGMLDYDIPGSPYVYTDEHVTEKPLADVHPDQVHVYQEVPAWNTEWEEQEEIDNGN